MTGLNVELSYVDPYCTGNFGVFHGQLLLIEEVDELIIIIIIIIFV